MSAQEATKVCGKCKIEKPFSDFAVKNSYLDGIDYYCRECRRKLNHKNPNSRWEAMLWNSYGMLPEIYFAKLKEQNGTCYICKEVCLSGNRLSVDHCDDTKIIRGLLCRTCNAALGVFDHDPELLRRAADYLEHWHPEKVKYYG